MSQLHDALIAKLRVIHPTSDPGYLGKTAEKLIATGALVHDGERVRIVGTHQQIAAAESIHRRLVGAVRGEFIGSLPADRPLDRAFARMQSMGIDPDEAFGASTPVAPRDEERAQTALKSDDPLTRVRARLHLLGIRDDNIGGLDDDPEAA